MISRTIKRWIIGTIAAVVGFALLSTAYDVAHGFKECPTKLQLFNPLDQPITYKLSWFDHNIPEYKGQPIIRCGGGLDAFERYVIRDEFRLCPGKHSIEWSVKIPTEEGIAYKTWVEYFLVKIDDRVILVTPGTVLRQKGM